MEQMHMHPGLDLAEFEADHWTPVIGFRRFRVPYRMFLRVGRPYVQISTRDVMLTPVNQNSMKDKGPRWKPGVNDAYCLRADHPAPHQSCKCGLHGFMEVNHALEYRSSISIIAAVIGWGKMLFDEEFWRAEHAMVLALAPADVELLKAGGEKAVKMLYNAPNWIKAAQVYVSQASAMYNIPVLEIDELYDYATLYGDPFGGHGNGTAQEGEADGAAGIPGDHSGQTHQGEALA